MRFLLALALLVPAVAAAQVGAVAEPVVVEGVLSAASDTLTGGEYKHAVEIEARAGERIVVVMTTADFDPYLIVRSPTGAQHENDDCTPGDRTRACLDWTADTTGVFRILATTYAVGETGRFELVAGTAPAGRAYTCPTPPPTEGLAGTVEYAVTFAPDGSYVGSAARTSAPALQIAADRLVGGCRAAALPPGAPQVPQALGVTFRFGDGAAPAPRQP